MRTEAASAPGALRVALVIPVRNAGRDWPRIAAAVRAQSRQPDHVLVVDSASTDDSARIAREHGFEVLGIPVEDFDHGGTRQMAALRCRDFDVLVYLTQDAELADPESLMLLLRAFDDPQVGAAYGRQLPRRGAGPIEAHARLFNYPARSRHCRLADAATLGLKAAFASNSYCAWRTQHLLAAGGFPQRLILAEDMVAAARMLQAGKVVAYVAESRVLHSHAYSVLQEFRRYFDIGVLHSDQRWLLDAFGKPEGEGLRFVLSEWRYLGRTAPWRIPEAFLRTLCKYLGYKAGRHSASLPAAWRVRMSMHSNYWSAARPQR